MLELAAEELPGELEVETLIELETENTLDTEVGEELVELEETTYTLELEVVEYTLEPETVDDSLELIPEELLELGMYVDSELETIEGPLELAILEMTFEVVAGLVAGVLEVVASETLVPELSEELPGVEVAEEPLGLLE